MQTILLAFLFFTSTSLFCAEEEPAQALRQRMQHCEKCLKSILICCIFLYLENQYKTSCDRAASDFAQWEPDLGIPKSYDFREIYEKLVSDESKDINPRNKCEFELVHILRSHDILKKYFTPTGPQQELMTDYPNEAEKLMHCKFLKQLEKHEHIRLLKISKFLNKYFDPISLNTNTLSKYAHDRAMDYIAYWRSKFRCKEKID